MRTSSRHRSGGSRLPCPPGQRAEAGSIWRSAEETRRSTAPLRLPTAAAPRQCRATDHSPAGGSVPRPRYGFRTATQLPGCSALYSFISPRLAAESCPRRHQGAEPSCAPRRTRHAPLRIVRRALRLLRCGRHHLRFHRQNRGRKAHGISSALGRRCFLEPRLEAMPACSRQLASRCPLERLRPVPQTGDEGGIAGGRFLP